MRGWEKIAVKSGKGALKFGKIRKERAKKKKKKRKRK